jgi:hypothetical protein
LLSVLHPLDAALVIRQQCVAVVPWKLCSVTKFRIEGDKSKGREKSSHKLEIRKLEKQK